MQDKYEPEAVPLPNKSSGKALAGIEEAHVVFSTSNQEAGEKNNHLQVTQQSMGISQPPIHHPGNSLVEQQQQQYKSHNDPQFIHEQPETGDPVTGQPPIAPSATVANDFISNENGPKDEQVCENGGLGKVRTHPLQQLSELPKKEHIAPEILGKEGQVPHSIAPMAVVQDGMPSKQPLAQISQSKSALADEIVSNILDRYQSANQISNQKSGIVGNCEFSAPTTRPFQGGQYQANSINNMGRAANQASKPFGVGTLDRQKKRDRVSKESRQSKKSRQQSREGAASGSRGGSSSLQRFQSQIPKKEYKNEAEIPSEPEQRVPYHFQKNQKPKPVQNSQSNQAPYHQNKQQLSPNRPVFSEGDNNEYSALLLHNQNLSGLHSILNGLKSLTAPLESLLQINQQFVQSKDVSMQPMTDAHPSSQLQSFQKELNENDLIKLYQTLQQNQQISDMIQNSAVSFGEAAQQHGRQDTSAAVAAAGTQPPSCNTKYQYQDQQKGLINGHSSIIQRILTRHPTDVARRIAQSSCQAENPIQSRPMDQVTAGQQSSQNMYSNVMLAKQGNQFEKNDIKQKQLREEAESKAKVNLADGFQLQDSVRIRSQRKQNSEKDIGSEQESVSAQALPYKNNLIRQQNRTEGHIIHGSNDLRFMNGQVFTSNGINQQQSHFQSRNSKDTDMQRALKQQQGTDQVGYYTHNTQRALNHGQMYPQGVDQLHSNRYQESGQLLTDFLNDNNVQTQLLGQNLRFLLPNTTQPSQINQQNLKKQSMQALDTANHIESDQTKKFDSLQKQGQRIQPQASEFRTSSATCENESPCREQDKEGLAAGGSEEERLRLRTTLLAQNFNPADSGQKIVEGKFQPPLEAPNADLQNGQNLLIEALKKASATNAQDLVLPLQGQNQLGKTLPAGVGSQHDGSQKMIQQMLPTELLSRMTGQDRKQLQTHPLKAANDTNVNVQAVDQLDSAPQNPDKLQPQTGLLPQNVNDVITGLNFPLTQTQHVGQVSEDQKVQKELPMSRPNQDQVPGSSDPNQVEPNFSHQFITHLLQKSKELTGLAQMLGITDVEAQLQNLISDLKETSGNMSSSAIGCGSLNSINGVHSRVSGDSAGSGTESGQKDREAMAGKDSKLSEDKSNGIKESGGSRISGVENDTGDNAGSGNDAVNQKQREDDKGSGSGVASKTNTNGSNTQKNGTSTDKESGSNGLDVAKLQELIENYYVPTDPNVNGNNHVAPTQDNNGNYLLGNNVVNNLLNGKAQNSNGKAQQLGSNQVQANDNRSCNNIDGNNDSGNGGMMRYNGPTSSSDEGNKPVNSRHGQIATSQSQSLGINHHNALAQQEHAYLTNQLKNQEKEISKLKTFILLNMFNEPKNLESDDRTKMTQNLLQDFVKQVLTGSTATGTLTGTFDWTNMTNINQQDMSTHEPAAMPAQPLQSNIGMSAQAQTQNAVAQLLQQQKSPSTLGQAGLLVQQKLNMANQHQQKLNSLLGKRTALQKQVNDKNQMQIRSNDQKDERLLSNTINEIDEKHRQLRNRIGMITAAAGVGQAPLSNPSLLGKITGTAMQNLNSASQNHTMMNTSALNDIKFKYQQTAERNSITAAKIKENQEKDALINNIMKYKQLGSGEGSDLCTTLQQQGLLESSDHKYEGTSAFIRLKAQIKKNMNVTQFLQQKAEIMNAVSKSAPDAILIGEKPKRPHHNMGEDTFRGSKFRGVSKNKCKWQMMIMINQKKVYIGAIHSEMEAAKYYDHIAILTQGLNSKTNFAYTAAQLQQIVNDYDFSNESNFYADQYSQVTSAYNTKHHTKQNLKEAGLEEYGLSNGHLSKRQRRELGANVQESSDENAMIGSHLYNERPAPGAGLLQAGGDQQLGDVSLQKIQSIGLDSLPNLLQSLQQKQKAMLQNGIQNKTRLLQAQMRMPGSQQMDAFQAPQQQSDQNGLNVQQNTAPASQLLQSLLGSQGLNQSQQIPNILSLMNIQKLNSGGGNQDQPEVSNLQDLRLYLEQSRKNGLQNNDMQMAPKPAALADQEQAKPIQVGSNLPSQIIPQSNTQKILNNLSSESWKNIQNHARFQPSRKPSNIQGLAASGMMNGGKLPGSDIQIQPAIFSQNPQQQTLQSNPEYLQENVQQQLMMLSAANAGADLNQRAQLPSGLNMGDLKNPMQMTQMHQQQAPAQSAVAAAPDPYKTPPQKKEDYCAEQ